MKQKLFTLFLALVASVSAIYASYKNVDGIWYDFHEYNKTAIVTYRGDYSNSYSNEYSGSVVIPSSVTYNGTTYSVTSIGSSAFRDCSSLTSVTIGESVTRIGDYAFYGCSSLTSVTIPNSVTSIGGGAFYGCSSLTSVTIPNSVTSIGEYAFEGCSSLTSVTIPESVTSIGSSAFRDCSALTSVTIPNSVTSIGEYAFEGCSSLTSVTIPNSVTSIGEYAFEGCSSLTSVTIPESVTSIGYAAFEDCSSLTSVTINSDAIVNKQYSQNSNLSHIFGSQVTEYVIGDNVKGIGKYAFRGCSSLTSVTIPNSVTSIGWDAFYGCSSLTSITIPNSVTSIGEYAFEGCSSLTSVTINSDAIVNKAYTFSSNISNIFGSQVTEYIIGDNVKGIGDYAFYGCSSLTSVTISNSVTSIGGNTFDGCSSLTSVHITDIAAWCNIDFGDTSANPLSSAHNLYLNGDLVKDLVIPNSVTSIGGAAFYGCSSLTSVTIPESVTSIGDWAFQDCSSLSSVTIPNSVTSIGSYAFEGCSSLTSVTIPNSVTSIGGSAFEGCSSLTSVTIPNSVTSIGHYAFEDCSKLISVTINSDAIVNKAYTSSSNISNIFGSQVTEYIIGDNVKGIGKSAFAYCSSLTSITIPESVTSIGEWAFSNCSSLTSINVNANNPNYCSIDGVLFNKDQTTLIQYPGGKQGAYTIPNSVTSIGEYAFRYCSSLTSITIPNSVTSIGEYAFRYCSSLTSITCEAETPPTIGGTYTFDGVSKSIPVYVPCGCVKAYKATNGWKDFTNIQEPLAEYSIEVYVNDSIMGTATVDYNTFCEGAQISATPNFGYHFVQWSDGNTDNPRTLELTQDTTLTAEFAQSFSGQCGDSLYWELVDTTLYITGKGEMYNYKPDSAPWKLLVSSIKGLTIAEDVTMIGYDAFDGCIALVTIVWNAKHAADAYNDGQYNYPVFYGICSQITSFNLGENVEYIPSYLCSGMENLTSVTIPESVTSIGTCAFQDCASLTSVTIPNSVTSIGDGAFYDCSSLTSIIIPSSVTSIRDYAFYGCSSLTSVTIPESVTSIGEAAFAYCSALTSIIIPNSVTSIRNYAFWGCSALTSVTTPESVTSIGKSAFEGCSALEFVVWNVKNCANASSLETAPFYGITSQIKSFTFGEAVEHVPAYLCYGMDKLTSVTIPNSVKTIGTSAFEGCARLGEVSLGKGLEEIAANAFAGCTRLYDIYTYATYPPFAEESSFANYNVYVYVPCEYQRDYTLDVVWGKFKFIECIDSEDVTTDGNVTVVPGFNDVTITWPTAENADTYSLVINKDNQPFCTLTFNADGQLLNIAFAPSRDGNNRPAQYAEQAVSGYRFTVTGLTEATQYVYNITTKDAANKTIATYSGEFTTMGGSTSAVEDILQNTTNVQKLLRNGQLLIIRDGVEYTVMGQEL